jgi:hypothetical protein
MTDTQPDQLPQVEIDPQSKELLKSTDSAIHAAADDIEDIGKTVDYSKMTLEQLQREVGKLRKEQQYFKYEVRQLIAVEIKEQVQPLVSLLNEFTTKKSSVVYIRFKVPLLDSCKRLCARIFIWPRFLKSSPKK